MGNGGCPMDPIRNVFVVFSYLLNFCREWHLCKFLILEELSAHLFGLTFPCPTSKKIGLEFTGHPLSSIKVGFFETLFLEK